MSRSLDLTGSNWGLRKRHEDRHIEKYDVRWVLHFWWEMWRPPLSSSAFIYTQVWESRMKCSSSSHGSSCIAGGTAQLWYVVIYWRLYWLHQHVLFSLQGSLAEPCLPLAGSMPFSQEALWQSHPHAKATFTASVSLPARLPCWTLLTSFMTGLCLLSTKDFYTALLMSKFLLSLFSYWSSTLLESMSLLPVIVLCSPC
jgi:hypothetical protein